MEDVTPPADGKELEQERVYVLKQSKQLTARARRQMKEEEGRQISLNARRLSDHCQNNLAGRAHQSVERCQISVGTRVRTSDCETGRRSSIIESNSEKGASTGG